MPNMLLQRATQFAEDMPEDLTLISYVCIVNNGSEAPSLEGGKDQLNRMRFSLFVRPRKA